MTKVQIIQKISKADDDILAFANSKPKLDPFRLKKTELEELLADFESMDRLFRKMAVKEGDK